MEEVSLRHSRCLCPGSRQIGRGLALQLASLGFGGARILRRDINRDANLRQQGVPKRPERFSGRLLTPEVVYVVADGCIPKPWVISTRGCRSVTCRPERAVVISHALDGGNQRYNAAQTAKHEQGILRLDRRRPLQR